MPVRRVALLTAGGLAPCLSSAVGGLIERYTAVAPDGISRVSSTNTAPRARRSSTTTLLCTISCRT